MRKTINAINALFADKVQCCGTMSNLRSVIFCDTMRFNRRKLDGL